MVREKNSHVDTKSAAVYNGFIRRMWQGEVASEERKNDMLILIGKWILLGILGLIGMKLLLWLWDEYPLILILLAVAVLGWRFLKPEKEPEIQTVENSVSVTEATEDKQYRPYWKTGVCQTLSEDACVVALFLNDTESGWTDYAVSWFLENKVEPGMEFIEKEGAKYGHDIDLSLLYHTGLQLSYDIPSNWPEFEDTHLLPVDAAAELGFASDQEMLAYHREQSGKEQIVYIFCFYKPGRAFAMGSGSGDTTDIEFTVVYSESNYSQIVNYKTIFHEILHLFGARDYYSENGERVNREIMANQLCPYDIMLGNYESGLMDVGRFTAYSIGWLDEMPQEYDDPNWWS